MLHPSSDPASEWVGMQDSLGLPHSYALTCCPFSCVHLSLYPAHNSLPRFLMLSWFLVQGQIWVWLPLAAKDTPPVLLPSLCSHRPFSTCVSQQHHRRMSMTALWGSLYPNNPGPGSPLQISACAASQGWEASSSVKSFSVLEGSSILTCGALCLPHFLLCFFPLHLHSGLCFLLSFLCLLFPYGTVPNVFFSGSCNFFFFQILEFPFDSFVTPCHLLSRNSCIVRGWTW